MNKWILENLNWLIPVIITAFFSLLNILIAAFNYKCSKKQREIQNDSFCYQLFDKRLNVYYSIQKTLAELTSSPNDADKLCQPFLRQISEVPFLFGKDIQDKCDDIYKIILRLSFISGKWKSMHSIPDDEYQRLSKEETELMKRVMDYLGNLPEIFQPYIGFSKYQITSKPTSKKQ